MANGSKGWDIFLENHMKGSCLGSLHINSCDLSLSFRCLVGWDAHSPSTLGTETVTEHYALEAKSQVRARLRCKQ